MAVAIEDAGFQIRDQIMWVYGSGFPKSLDVSKAIDKAAGAEREVIGIDKTAVRVNSVKNHIEGQVSSLGLKAEGSGVITAPATAEAKQWQGWGTALKPAHEPMVLARKPIVGTVANNVLTYGVGGLNIDGARVEGELIETTNGNANAIYGDLSANGGESWKSHNQGRFPANFIHDGSDEVLALFPDTNPAKRSNRGVGMNESTIYGGASLNFDSVRGFDDNGGSAARFFYCAKASKRDRNEGLDDFAGKEIGAKGNGLARKCATCSASVIEGCDCPDRTFVNPTRANHHPTVKPTDLMRYLCRLITPPAGIVLDPFMGSGSTGKAAILEGFDFIGIDQSAEYVEIAKARIEWAANAK
jgi:site-specific DNA-methyltransferase (adenine-specific)